jgi:transcription antitermination factor NusG
MKLLASALISEAPPYSEHAPPWFVVTVKPQHEATVAEAFDRRDIEQFSPMYESCRPHKRADRRAVSQPLFPGYVFCRFERSARTMVLQTPGVTSIVGFGGIAQPVPEEEVERVRAMVASGVPVLPHAYIEEGDRVRIEAGPLRGLEGTVMRTCDDYRLVVSVTFLRRSVSASVDRAFVVPIAANKSR